MNTTYLDNWRYITELRPYKDAWVLSGLSSKTGSIVHVSVPVALDKENKIVTTRSGSKYQLRNCSAN